MIIGIGEAYAMNENNITLIGMPASGKSTIGVIMAKFIRYDFLDTDLVIQKETGHSLAELLSEHGIDGFCDIENAICSCVKAERTVIATGGSAVYGEDAMRNLNAISKVVYLRTPLAELCNRLGDLEQRGVVLRDGQSLEDLYQERVPLYERYADIIVDETGKRSEQIVREIIQKLGLNA